MPTKKLWWFYINGEIVQSEGISWEPKTLRKWFFPEYGKTILEMRLSETEAEEVERVKEGLASAIQSYNERIIKYTELLNKLQEKYP